jgi:hypothetical protein
MNVVAMMDVVVARELFPEASPPSTRKHFSTPCPSSAAPPYRLSSSASPIRTFPFSSSSVACPALGRCTVLVPKQRVLRNCGHSIHTTYSAGALPCKSSRKKLLPQRLLREGLGRASVLCSRQGLFGAFLW